MDKPFHPSSPARTQKSGGSIAGSALIPAIHSPIHEYGIYIPLHMKFSCTQENLIQGLAAVSHIASKNVNLPILNNVLIKVEDKSIQLATTNLEIAVTAQVRGKVDESGECTLPSRLLADYVGLLTGDRVDVTADGDAAAVSSGSNKTKIKGLPASEFPLIPKVSRETAFRVLAGDFRRAVGRVIFAVSPNESRPEISGVLLRFTPDGTNGTLTLAATDSYRLAEAKVALHEGGKPAGERAVIVPARTLAEVQRILSALKDGPDSPATVEIALSDSQILFVYDTVEIVSRTIEGNYPEYRAVIPEKARTVATLSRDALVKAVKSAALFSRTGLYDVHFTYDPGEKRLTLSATDSQIGEQEAALTPSELTGDANKITLNYRYVLDGLSAMDAAEVKLQVVDGNAPCLITPQHATADYLYLVMPIKV